MPPRERREQLTRCAVETFASRGLNAASHSDLARVAEVALPTVFHYFQSRDDLVEAVLSEVSRFLLDEILQPHVDSDTPAPDAIETVLMTFCNAIDDHPHHVQVWLEWSVGVRSGPWEAYLLFYERALEGIGAILARGVAEGSFAADLDVSDAARVVVGLAHMIVQMRFSGAGRDQVVHTVHSLVRRYMEGDHDRER